MTEPLLGSLRLLGVNRAPTCGGDELSAKSSAWSGRFTGFPLVKGASRTHLLSLVLWVFGRVHFGGVFLVAESNCRGIGFFEFDRRWWRSLAESATAEQGGSSD